MADRKVRVNGSECAAEDEVDGTGFLLLLLHEGESLFLYQFLNSGVVGVALEELFEPRLRILFAVKLGNNGRKGAVAPSFKSDVIARRADELSPDDYLSDFRANVALVSAETLRVFVVLCIAEPKIRECFEQGFVFSELSLDGGEVGHGAFLGLCGQSS